VLPAAAELGFRKEYVMSDDNKHNSSDDCSHGDEFMIVPGTNSVVRHFPDHTVQRGSIVKIEDGVPIPPGAEIVEADSLGDGRYAIRQSFKIGPAQVATKPYRDGWDRTFKNAPN